MTTVGDILAEPFERRYAFERATGFYEAREDCSSRGCMWCREWLKTNTRPVFSLKGMVRLTGERYPRRKAVRRVAGWSATGKGLCRRFDHPSGWVVHHCGHPTANYPWACIDPGGRIHTSEACSAGYAFRYLADAIEHAERHLLGPRQRPKGP